MKRIDRYLLKELFVPFIVGTFAVVPMFLVNQLMAELKAISVQHVPAAAIAQVVLYKAPFYLAITLPIGATLAVALAFSRIVRESELTAMRTAGASILRTTIPILFFGLGVGLLDFWLAEKVTPVSERAFYRVAAQVNLAGGVPDFASQVTLKLQRFTAYIGSVERKKDGSLELVDVFLIERPHPHQESVITADRGEYKNGAWILYKPWFRQFQDQDLASAKSEEEMVINERVVISDLMGAQAPETMSLDELGRRINKARQDHAPTDLAEMAYYERFSIPFTCLVFSFVAPIFAVRYARQGAFAGVLLSFGLVILYYNAFVVSTEILGKGGMLTPWLAAWLPNILFFLWGLLMFRRLE